MNPALARDVEALGERVRWLRARARTTLESGRLLVTIAAHASAGSLLAGTLPDLLVSARSASLSVDLVLGLDHGFADMRFLSDLTGQGVVHLTGGLDPLARPSDRDRIVIVRNPPARAPGKVNVVREILDGLLLPQLERGLPLPSTMLCMDAESRLFDEASGNTMRGRATGLSRLVDAACWGDAPRIVGTRVRLAPYRVADGEREGRLDPDLDASVEPIYEAINLLHGWFPGFAWLPGGGMLGRSDLLIGLLATICEAYPYSLVEDVHLTVLAKAAGVAVEFSDAVVSTNRCEGDSEEHIALEQLCRWMSGVRDLERLYGADAVAGIAGGVRRRQLVRCAPSILSNLLHLQRMRRMARPSVLPLLYAARAQIQSVLRGAVDGDRSPEGASRNGSWIPAGACPRGPAVPSEARYRRQGTIDYY